MKYIKKIVFVVCIVSIAIIARFDGIIANADTGDLFYYIRYNDNGGKGAMTMDKVPWGKSVTLTTNKYKKDNYMFMGWNSLSSGKGTWYRDGQKVKNLADSPNEKVVLYAIWERVYDATASSATIKKCSAVSKNNIKIEANIPELLDSSDKYYYLVRVNPFTDKCIAKVAKLEKSKAKKYIFRLDLNKDGAYVQNKYAIAVKKGNSYFKISKASFVRNPEKAATNTQKYFVPETKKGIQYTNYDELKSCGAKNTFLNLPISSVVTGNTYVKYVYNGKAYYFTDLAAYKITIYDLNRNNINVTLQILLNWGDGSYNDLIEPSARQQGRSYYTWNVKERAGRERMEAIFSYLSTIFGKSDCHVDNWILGNEVNACDVWNYRGALTKTKFIKVYSYSFLSLYKAVRSNKANSKVFICLDNSWNVKQHGFSSKDFLNRFSKQIKNYQNGINWNVAYHAYPAPLGEADFWKNKNINTTENSPYVTIQNIDVLTNYVKKHFSKKTRVILSEQGFTATKGEKIQSAALALAYYKVACNPMIDAFIIRCYRDDPLEASMGLTMGIYGRSSFKVFKYMDTKKSIRYTKSYLKTIGVSSWSSIVRNYNESKLWKNYRIE